MAVAEEQVTWSHSECGGSIACCSSLPPKYPWANPMLLCDASSMNWRVIVMLPVFIRTIYLSSAGTRCDECSPAYYGNPEEAGGQCQPCQCNNNIDMLDPESCDARTGECLRCLYHSEGAACESCMLGYYGNALLQDCRSKYAGVTMVTTFTESGKRSSLNLDGCVPAECVCNRLGSVPSSCPSSDCHCDRSSGQCHCLPNVVGQHCDRCAPDTWNMAMGTGCQTCDCDPKHSYGTSCNEVSSPWRLTDRKSSR